MYSNITSTLSNDDVTITNDSNFVLTFKWGRNVDKYHHSGNDIKRSVNYYLVISQCHYHSPPLIWVLYNTRPLPDAGLQGTRRQQRPECEFGEATSWLIVVVIVVRAVAVLYYQVASPRPSAWRSSGSLRRRGCEPSSYYLRAYLKTGPPMTKLLSGFRYRSHTYTTTLPTDLLKLSHWVRFLLSITIRMQKHKKYHNTIKHWKHLIQRQRRQNNTQPMLTEQ
jgi:hypothetical protein